MSNTPHRRWHLLWVLPPLIVGVLVFKFAVGNKKPPTLHDELEPSRVVRVISVPKVDLLPQVQGYGTVQPAKVWRAVAQVAGQVLSMHAKLRDGEIIEKGSLLFEIDPSDYKLSLAQAQAELAELSRREENTKASLKIESRSVSLSKQEFQRLHKLAQSGTLSRSNADVAERNLLTAQIRVQNLKNTLALLPAQRQVLKTKIKQAERNLSYTQVRAPFNLKVSQLAIEAHQYVGKGQVLFAGDAVDSVEIIAQIAMPALRTLFIGRAEQITNIAQLNDKLMQVTGFKPHLRLDLGSHHAQWPAEFVRFHDSINAQTRAMGVVLKVDNPLSYVIPGERPPLSKGMFVQVQLNGHIQKGRLVIPRSAIRAGQVYVMNAEKRLEIRAVKILFNQGHLSVIKSGLQAGEQLVLSDLVPAVAGMLLDPQLDEAQQQALLQAAKGEAL